MGFTKEHATDVLLAVFQAGNTIDLTCNTNAADGTYEVLSGTGYNPYVIDSTDFGGKDGAVYNKANILFGLAEGSWGTADGFIVRSSNKVLYIAELTSAVSIAADTVPVFKKAVDDNGNTIAGAGIYVTLDVATATAST